MKKVVTVLFIAVCACVALPAQAQFFQMGIKGGANVSKISFNKEDRGGFFIGPMAEVTIPILGLGIDAALLYNQKGSKSDEFNLKQSGLDIPVNLKWTFGLGSMFGIYVAAGPDFFFNFKDDTYNVTKRKSMVGMNFGAGLKLIKHLQVGVNYNIPLGNSGEVEWRDVGDALKYRDYKIKTWQMSLAYMF